jgi:hypothetical protein
MKMKTGIALIILGTLVIGIAVGALANRAVIRHRLNQTIRRVNPGYLPGFIQEVVEPDSEQARKIKSVLNEHTRRMQELRAEYQMEMRDLFQSLWDDLEPLLTPAQKLRIRRRPFGPREFLRNLRSPPPPPPEHKDKIVQKELDWLDNRLSLTPSQTKRIREILGRPPLKPEDITPEKPGMPNLRRQVIEESLIKNILTRRQRKIFQTRIREWRAMRRTLRRPPE